MDEMDRGGRIGRTKPIVIVDYGESVAGEEEVETISEFSRKFGEIKKILRIKNYISIKFKKINEAENCILSLTEYLPDSVHAFLHDGRDLAISDESEKEEEVDGGWDSYLEDSDGSEFMIRTE